jgi:predicted RNA-binding Zn ribbon-like protein
MATSKQQQQPFDLCGGHPALDFINSLDNRFREDGPLELLMSYADLLKFTQQTELLDAREVGRLASATNPDAAVRALRCARQLREALADAFYASVDGRAPREADLRILERHFQASNAHRELRWGNSVDTANARATAAWDWGRYETEVELPGWAIAQSAARLMMSRAMDQVRTCGVETCRWLFLDTSKNHTRRWCNMRVCGNRMKARRFQARREK